MKKTYSIKKACGQITIDAIWDKPAWSDIESAQISISHWPVQTCHFPETRVKLQYDAEHIYVIFQVHDQYVRAVSETCNGPVWKDSCVEFFFAPYSGPGTSYFNLEVNCCGVPLMQHHTGPRENTVFIDASDCRAMRIAGSVSAPVRHEIATPLTWTVEYALRLDTLVKYAAIERPAPGVIWHGNFYKCADDSSHPHWMAWSPIVSEKPNFHRPDYFGILEFF
ncbi:MAG: carbohydrate-binding family 9-like protein [Planctomycetaceae bacterium]|nr:carbohydrate-binding family 9-like protein [Planctomycetaceae bacterium]